MPRLNYYYNANDWHSVCFNSHKRAAARHGSTTYKYIFSYGTDVRGDLPFGRVAIVGAAAEFLADFALDLGLDAVDVHELVGVEDF